MLSILKTAVRRFLQTTDLYYRMKDFSWFHWYLAAFYPRNQRRKRQERRFYEALFSECGSDLVFDIGANNGEKTAIFAKIARKVVCVEPNPKSEVILRSRFLRNDRVSIIPKGVGASLGTKELSQFGETSCYNTFSEKWVKSLGREGQTHAPGQQAVVAKIAVPMTTLDALIAEHGMPSYVKIDVEGYELDVIRGLSAPVPLISFECNLPEFKIETKEIIANLVGVFPSSSFNYCIEEPPAKFESANWLSREAMSRIVETSQLSYLEIYCKSC